MRWGMHAAMVRRKVMAVIWKVVTPNIGSTTHASFISSTNMPATASLQHHQNFLTEMAKSPEHGMPGQIRECSSAIVFALHGEGQHSQRRQTMDLLKIHDCKNRLAGCTIIISESSFTLIIIKIFDPNINACNRDIVPSNSCQIA